MQSTSTTLVIAIAIILSFNVSFVEAKTPNGAINNNHNEKSLVGQLDSSLVWNWDAGTSAYDQLVSGTFDTYNTGNQLTTSLVQNYSGGSWINYYEDNYTYNGQGYTTNDIHLTWSGSAWVNNQQWNYTYDGNNNQVAGVKQLWTSGAWVNSIQNINHYNGSNVLVSGIQQSWVSSAWSTTDSFVYTYNGSNQLINEVDISWSGGSWVNNQQWVYTYSGNNVATVVVQTWTGAAWVDETTDTYTYNGSNELIGDLTDVWISSTDESPSQTLTYGYDGNGNNTSIINQQYQGNAWVNQDSTHLYYQEVQSSIANIGVLDATVSLYPNPANSFINVVCSIAGTTPVMATLYDVAGRAIITRQLSNNVSQVNVSYLQAGIYHMVLTDDKGNRAVNRLLYSNWVIPLL